MKHKLVAGRLDSKPTGRIGGVVLSIALSTTMLLACAPVAEVRTESRLVFHHMESKQPAPELDRFQTSSAVMGDRLEIRVDRQRTCRLRGRDEIDVKRELVRTPSTAVVVLELVAATAGVGIFAGAYKDYRDEQAAIAATGDGGSDLIYEPIMAVGALMALIGGTAAAVDIASAHYESKDTTEVVPTERLVRCADAGLQGQDLMLVGRDVRAKGTMDAAGRATFLLSDLAPPMPGAETQLDIVLGGNVIGYVTIPAAKP